METMIRRKLLIWIVVSALTAVWFLSSCGDAEEKANVGRKIMEEWLNENRSGAEIKSVSAMIMDLPSRKHYITDYVEGTYLCDGNEYNYIVDIFYKTVYISEGYAEFVDKAESYFREILSLDDRYDIQSFDACLLFPAVSVSDPYKSREETFTMEVVPAYITDVREFLNSSDRLPVSIDAEIQVSENGYMSQIQLVDLINSSGGIYYHSLDMKGGHNESLHFKEDAGTYERWAWTIAGDFRLYGQTAYKSVERIDGNATLEINKFEKEYDYSRDVHFIRTTDGWQIRFEQMGTNPMFCITVSENSGICRMSPEIQKVDDSKNRIPCIWGDTEDGYRELLNSDGTKLYINYDCDLLISD